MDGGISIGTAYRFNEGANHVVVLIATFIVANGSTVNGFLGMCQSNAHRLAKVYLSPRFRVLVRGFDLFMLTEGYGSGRF